MNHLITSPEVWYTVSFIIFVCVAYRFAKIHFEQALQNHRQQVAGNIDAAEASFLKAQKRRDKTLKRAEELDQYLRTIEAKMQVQLTETLRTMKFEHTTAMSDREAGFDQRLKSLELRAGQNLSDYMVRITIKAVRSYLEEGLSPSIQEAYTAGKIEHLVELKG